MLPTQLSNGICSLNPQEDRFAFSCLMRLDEQGNILGYNFVKSVIRSRVKGVYKEINALLESMAAETTEPVEADEAAGPIDPEKLNALKEKYAEVLEQLPIMDELYRKRLVLRKQRGGMEIESDEAKLIIDENGRCVDIVKRGRGTSECMIEEFMLLANQCAANAGRTNKVPFVYRVHEAPDAEKMEKLSATLLACGLNAKFKNPIPTQLELAALLDETRGQPIQTPVHTGILRSMQKARYAPQPLGHYGLVLADYAHFTSPIRRYPDLAIHRILSEMLLGANNAQMTKDFTDFAARASEQSSKQEVTAVRIERDVEDLYKAEYMHNHLGEVYMGTVAGAEIIKLEVPTRFHRAGAVLEDAMQRHKPDAVICVGQAGGRAAITPEKVAINLMDGRIPDNAGYQPVDMPIREDGETAYFTSLPVKAMVQRMRDAGIPAAVSYTAGTYVCNYLLYTLLYLIDKKCPNVRGGFIHVPYAMEQVINKPLGTPSMDLCQIARGLETAVEAVAACG